MTWHTGRLCLADAETTGTSPHYDRIVSFAVLYVGGRMDTQSQTWLLNPGIPIPQAATDVHGITTEQAQTDGVAPADAVAEIAAAILDATRQGHPVVGHNLVYDLTMLVAELHRHGHHHLAAEVAGIRPVVDTMVIERHLDPYRPGKPNGRRPDDACGSNRLIDCCRLWGIDLDEADAHGAEADALAAGRLAWRLAADPHRFAEFDGPRGIDRISPATWPLDKLHDWQAQQYAKSAASFQSYMRGEQRKKPDPVDPTFTAPTAWPVQPLPTDWAPDTLPTTVESDAA